jgi:hypothetical protein
MPILVFCCEPGVLLGDIQHRMLHRLVPAPPGTRLVTGWVITTTSTARTIIAAGASAPMSETSSCALGRNPLPRREHRTRRFFMRRSAASDYHFITSADLQLTGWQSDAGRRVDPVLPNDEFATLSDESDTTFEYTARIDCLHTTTRGIFTRANHLDAAATRETAALAST